MELLPEPILVLVLLVPFAVTAVALHFILFKPMLEFIGDRKTVVESAKSEAESLTDKIEDRMRTLDERVEAARVAVGQQRSEARARAMAEEARILAAARAEADAKIDEALVRIENERKAASSALRQTAESLSQEVAAQVLGRELQA